MFDQLIESHTVPHFIISFFGFFIFLLHVLNPPLGYLQIVPEMNDLFPETLEFLRVFQKTWNLQNFKNKLFEFIYFLIF
jgi:hypothetical protein